MPTDATPPPPPERTPEGSPEKTPESLPGRSPGSPVDPQPDPRPWFMRNRLRSFFLLLLAVIVIGAASATTAYTIYVRRLKASVPYQMAVDAVARSAAVRRYLGQPIEPTWLAQGLVDEDTHYGEFTFRIQGPTGKGTVRGIAERPDAASDWALVFLDVAAYSDYGVDVVTLINDKPPTGNLPTPTDEAKQRYGVE